MDDRMHLLLQVDPGHAQEAARYVAGLPAVIAAVETTGPYDVIATVGGGRRDVQRTLSLARQAPGLCVLRVCEPAGVTRAAPAWEEGPGWTPWSAAVATNA